MGNVVYGTAGKGENTATMVRESIIAGFRHIASAAFHEKYDEGGVGRGIGDAIANNKEGVVKRQDLFLQTMFVPQNNGDRKKNHNEGPKSIEEQVHESIRSSLTDLRTNYIDAVIYHNFRNKCETFEEMMIAWKVLEEYVDKGVVRYLGIDNVYKKDYLDRLVKETRIKPSIVQNRFHSNRQFDVSVHSFLVKHNIVAQKFWVLTGSRGPLKQNNDLKNMAQSKGLTPQLLMYFFVMSLGITPMIGTTSREHMDQDIELAKKIKDGDVLFDDYEKKTFATFFKMNYNAMIE